MGNSAFAVDRKTDNLNDLFIPFFACFLTSLAALIVKLRQGPALALSRLEGGGCSGERCREAGDDGKLGNLDRLPSNLHALFAASCRLPEIEGRRSTPSTKTGTGQASQRLWPSRDVMVSRQTKPRFCVADDGTRPGRQEVGHSQASLEHFPFLPFLLLFFCLCCLALVYAVSLSICD